MKNFNVFVMGGILAAWYGSVELVLLFLSLYFISRVDVIKFKI